MRLLVLNIHVTIENKRIAVMSDAKTEKARNSLPDQPRDFCMEFACKGRPLT